MYGYPYIAAHLQRLHLRILHFLYKYFMTLLLCEVSAFYLNIKSNTFRGFFWQLHIAWGEPSLPFSFF